MTGVEIDPFDARRALSAFGPLRDFNIAGVLAAADVHVASRLALLSGETSSDVVLAVALAVRAPRLGHVHVDLATIRDTAAVDAEEAVDLSELAWPPVASWLSAVAASPLVAVGESPSSASPEVRPLRLVDERLLYLDRYWQEERRVAADLRGLAAEATSDVSLDALGVGLRRLFADEIGGRQSLAAATAVLRRFAVVAGGPGTGKTTTVARIVALLLEQASALGAPPPLIALAAPTGKAAARLEEAVHAEAASLPVSDTIRSALVALSASTLHRLLGWRPGSQSRFRHHRGQRLPHDVVIVDETSMVSLSMMARLVEAVRPDSRLIIVGDPGQLASIEAGSVLGDVVGPAADGLVMSPAARDRLSEATGTLVAGAAATGESSSIADGIVVLDRVHRFGGGIARLADAIRRGDADATIATLSAGLPDVTWLPVDVADADAGDALALIHNDAVAAARAAISAARVGDAFRAIEALSAFRLLCAHRRGPHGVAVWTSRIESWLATAIPDFTPDTRWYAGRPLLVTENDYELQLYNGDTGVVVTDPDGRLTAAFERRSEIVHFSPSRLSAIDTVFAMTIHKSQGSQFATAAVLLPPAGSRILTRELLYTAATRAQERLVVVGTEAAIRSAVERPVARASGLGRRLWG